MEHQWTLSHVAKCVNDEASQAWDATIDPSELRMQNGELHLNELDGPSRTLKPNTWAEGQLCSKLGIPVTYFRKCPPSLKDTQFEYWMDRFGQAGYTRPKILLRGSGDTLRGVLSDRYACIDNKAIIDAVESLLSVGLTIRGFELTDVSFHLRMIDPTSIQDVGNDDPVYAGIHISNSEVGMRTLAVDALVYRRVCTNGLIRLVKNKSIYAKKHIGKCPTDLVGIVRAASEQALALGSQSVRSLIESKTRTVADPEEKVAHLAKTWNLNEDIEGSIIHQLGVEENPDTAYGLINAITSVARLYRADDRFKLESLAGSLLN